MSRTSATPQTAACGPGSRKDPATSSATPIAVPIPRPGHRAPEARDRRGRRSRAGRSARTAPRHRRRRTRSPGSPNASGTQIAAIRKRRHRGEQRDPDPALLRIDDAGQPRIGRPRPPEQGEDEHALAEPLPGRVLRHQGRALRDREDEDQVEEELERQHPVLLAERSPEPQPLRLAPGLHGAHPATDTHDWQAANRTVSTLLDDGIDHTLGYVDHDMAEQITAPV